MGFGGRRVLGVFADLRTIEHACKSLAASCPARLRRSRRLMQRRDRLADVDYRQAGAYAARMARAPNPLTFQSAVDQIQLVINL